jgi:hypothetical protein
MTWGTTTAAKKTEEPVTVGYGKDYYRDLFNNNRANDMPVRMALVGKENCAKTGLAVAICRQVRPEGTIYVFDRG